MTLRMEKKCVLISFTLFYGEKNHACFLNEKFAYFAKTFATTTTNIYSCSRSLQVSYSLRNMWVSIALFSMDDCVVV